MTPNPPLIPFFAQVAEETLTPFMASHGFAPAEQSNWSIKYRRGRIKVSFGYDATEIPRPVLIIAVGLEDPDGQFSSTGLWRALPDSPDVSYSSWEFETATELREVLGRVIEQVMPHSVSLWESEETMIGLHAEQQAQIDKHYQETTHRGQVLAARRAFDAGRYAEARDSYVLIGEDGLSAADRRRLYLARKHLTSPD